MSKVYNSALQARVEQFLKEKGLSQAKAAPIMGFSPTALSHYRRSMYEGDVAALERKIEEFFKAQDEQDASTEKALPYKPIQDYIPTSISEDVYKLIRYCQLEKGMVIIHGDAGIGKTKGAEKFVRDNPTSSVYIQATPSIGTLGNLLKMLARALRVPESRSKLELALSIREKLEGTNRVIIIDEAQHLQLRALEEIRTWTDPNPITGQQGVGIALIGNTETYTRMVGKQEARFAQLFSRIRMNRFYSTHKVTAEDVKALFPKLAEEGQKKEASFLHGICQSKWGVRGAVNVYNNAVNNEDITYKKGANRKHSKIDGLDPALREAVEQMLLSNATYGEIVDFLGQQGVGISVASVCRYAQAYQANVQMLAVAQENFRRMMDELDRYPDLDTTEAIIRLTSQNLLNALAVASEEDWQGVSIDKMLREANALVRAAAYKKRVEMQNQDATEAGLEAVRALVFDAMAREQPELYKQVNDFLNAKKREGLEKG